MSHNPGRRRLLGDSAIQVLAREGVRGLTFRAVDTEAQVPTGTAHNYFADRDALVEFTATRIRDRLAVEQPGERPGLTARMRAQFENFTDNRECYLALLELRLEATRRPAIREVLGQVVRAELDTRAGEHADSAMPGGGTEATLLYLAMLGLAVEHLTLPDTLAGHDIDQLLATLADRIATEHPDTAPNC
ncbi:TetR/AcrR family transcriptional regulator [Sciscionella sediminilitoris]|uniref:TetR/AcrR family transcriptional regulator n=1 Tax=Sciscionella sediminilitoris TaxID=1445613 RepID=UPI00056CC042|nr:TetR family transcriptional regulator [Sciscionella sp. SE31]